MLLPLLLLALAALPAVRAAPVGRPTRGGLALLHEIEDDVRELDAALGSGDHVDGAMHRGALRELERRVTKWQLRDGKQEDDSADRTWFTIPNRKSSDDTLFKAMSRRKPFFKTDKTFEEETVQMIKDATDDQVKYVDAIGTVIHVASTKIPYGKTAGEGFIVRDSKPPYENVKVTVPEGSQVGQRMPVRIEAVTGVTVLMELVTRHNWPKAVEALLTRYENLARPHEDCSEYSLLGLLKITRRCWRASYVEAATKNGETALALTNDRATKRFLQASFVLGSKKGRTKGVCGLETRVHEPQSSALGRPRQPHSRRTCVFASAQPM